MSNPTEIPVLIVGAGVAGLMASLCLAHHGIDSIVVERHQSTSIHPRARGLNARTCEIFRELGIEEAVREAGKEMNETGGMYGTKTTLRDLVETWKRKPPSTKNTEKRSSGGGILSSTTPTEGLFVTQDKLEPVLLDVARERGVDARYYTELVDFSQDGDWVTATLKDRKTDEVTTVRAKYMIASDGAKSPIRTKVNVPLEGQGTLGHLINVQFTADLTELIRGRTFSMCLIERPGFTGLLTSIGNANRWVIHISYDPTKGESPDDFPADKVERLLQEAIGIPVLDVHVRAMLPWEPAVKVATEFRHDRIFLMGDAAHQMPPYAGQGATSAMQDAHNLAWKLAAVLKGHAGHGLLDTYSAERQPATKAAAEISAIGADERGLIPVARNWTFFKSIYHKLWIIAGYGYGYEHSKGVCKENTSPLGGATWRPWTIPSLLLAIDGRPGRRVPHVWVDFEGKRSSTIDVCKGRLVLLTGADGHYWRTVAYQLRKENGYDIEAYRVGPYCDLKAPNGKFEGAVGINSRGAILVRPDGFVVWRSRRMNPDLKQELDAAIKTALCLEN